MQMELVLVVVVVVVVDVIVVVIVHRIFIDYFIFLFQLLIISIHLFSSLEILEWDSSTKTWDSQNGFKRIFREIL